jgi:hypothetical protein
LTPTVWLSAGTGAAAMASALREAMLLRKRVDIGIVPYVAIKMKRGEA